MLFLYPSGLLDFGAPNPGRHHISCSRRQVGGHMGVLPLALEGQHRRPQRVGVAEVQLGPPIRLTGVIVAEMAGC